MLPRVFSRFLQNGLNIVNFDWHFRRRKRCLLIRSRRVKMMMVVWVSLDVMVVMNGLARASLRQTRLTPVERSRSRRKWYFVVRFMVMMVVVMARQS